ncbi:MAG TPA: hypothetical protein VFV98_01950 [Vicinamibacterales bacterium]|nr:hypothetical protein [Vicinamibacterales bacterium]
MRLHLDVLGWLHVIWGAFGVLSGLALAVLAAGAASAFVDPLSASGSGHAVVWTFVVVGSVFGLGGLAMIAAGRGLLRRSSAARAVTLVLALVNLLAVPFGTALGVYAFWALLNDDARREFGRPPRTPADGRALERI